MAAPKVMGVVRSWGDGEDSAMMPRTKAPGMPKM
jgi:hypothetical protein